MTNEQTLEIRAIENSEPEIQSIRSNRYSLDRELAKLDLEIARLDTARSREKYQPGFLLSDKAGRIVDEVIKEKDAQPLENNNATYTSVAKVIGSDFYKGLCKVGKGALKCAIVATYPITGNLSLRLRKGIQKIVGEEYYNEETADSTSFIINTALYPTLGYLATEGRPMGERIIFGIFGGAAVGCIEFLVRTGPSLVDNDFKYGDLNYALASFPGKIVSLPIEGAIYFGKGIKKLVNKTRGYLANAKQRAGNVQSQQIEEQRKEGYHINEKGIIVLDGGEDY